MKNRLIQFLSVLLLFVCVFTLVSCNNDKNDDNNDSDNKVDEEVIVTKTEYFLLDDYDLYRNPYYIYETNKEGPSIAIVGGIHGDENAAWNAALRLVDLLPGYEGICGTILLCPQCNILADIRNERFVGKNPLEKNSIVKTVNGVEYTDLNRSFNNGRANNATATTIMISDAICKMVDDFAAKYGIDAIIDLHEASFSWNENGDGDDTGSLGDSLIYSNNALDMEEVLSIYNDKYRLEGETRFIHTPTAQKGSFNYYHTFKYEDCYVFTTETNRRFDKVNRQNLIDIEIRIRQQINLLNAFFDFIWERE